MHRALEILEIVENILTYLGEGSTRQILNVGLANHKFFNFAMNIMWGTGYIQPSKVLQPLVTSGALVWRTKPVGRPYRAIVRKTAYTSKPIQFLETQRLPSTTDWERFDLYARRVRSLELNCEVGEDALNTFIVGASRRSSFPRLRYLSIHATKALGDDTLLACTQLFNPLLLSFRLTSAWGVNVPYRVLHSWFNALALQCLQLVTLDISITDIHEGNDDSQNNGLPRPIVAGGQSSLQLLLQILARLRHLTLRTEIDLINDLAALPSLERLTLYSGVRSTPPDLTPSQHETVQVHQFPNLQVLNFNSTNDNSADIWHIVELSRCSPLRDVRLHWEIKSPGSLRDILTIYAGSPGRMETIELDCEAATSSLPYSSSCINIGHLSPLFSPRFKFLTDLSILHPILFDLNDDDMITIAQHLPHLRTLQLGSAPGESRADWPSPRVTIRSLFALETACCELERIDLSIDLRGVISFQEPEAGPRRSKLSDWDILHSKMGNGKAIAFTLATLFPRLTHIRIPSMLSDYHLVKLERVERFLQKLPHLRNETPISLDRPMLERCWRETP